MAGVTSRNKLREEYEMLRLEGQVAVITGASSGIGLHFAQLLAREGCAVALLARRGDRLAQQVEALKAGGSIAAAISLDIVDTGSIGGAFDQAQELLGPMSILVNSAGISTGGLALDFKVADWDDTFDINTRGTFFAAREAAARMLANGRAAGGDARIVNISSINAFRVAPGLAAYCASKAAVASYTKILAREWARSGISVNALCPGYIATPMTDEWFATEAGQAQLKSWPRRRLVEIEALDDIMLALCGRPGRFITGSLITVDDGQSL
jgi:NAD(P)-dependent dehydrogenase (short-subunit alcohol dehydrogenase family)